MLRVSPCFLLAALVAVPVVSCRGEATAAQDPSRAATAPPPPQSAPAAKSPASGGALESCDALPLTGKEACYARQAPDLIAECERMRLHHCAPYAKVHELEKQLEQLNAALLEAARSTYASYEGNQPGYVKDVEQFLAEANRTWRAHRDAHCNLEPFIQGMSRDEAADLTEACRADRTAARLDELKQMLSILTEETGNEQRKD